MALERPAGAQNSCTTTTNRQIKYYSNALNALSVTEILPGYWSEDSRWGECHVTQQRTACSLPFPSLAAHSRQERKKHDMFLYLP